MTEEKISPELFEHLVDLAAIALDPTQSEYLRSELNKQLNVIEELKAIPIDESVPLASHGVVINARNMPALRRDEYKPSTHAERILEEAPENEDGYFVVPEIPHEDM
jgi:aspartyl-tRNA(Asn)/glutamyl-tRNA(Gln) amidotransferase subunit C